jgi:hypothetical protein
MKQKDFEKPKKVLFEKLTVKETEKVTGGDTLPSPVSSDSCPEAEDVGGDNILGLRPLKPNPDCS